ncbi:MAG: 2-oxoacid:acceptor oxidoreductase family protein [Candidatus Omnitrophica bacterium]|nr:2-oxoacid:acceptor oxidoreductase family protein [Candidatus Omnitrophota bacterium]
MEERIIISGSGGQGIMLMGKILAEACLKENRQVTWMPAYGAEVRGGTAYCMVVISDEEIGSPYINEADILVSMNEPSLYKFKKRLKKEGILIVNSSLLNKLSAGRKARNAYPFSDIALGLGNIKVANMVALGAYLALTKKSALKKNILRVIEEIAPPDKKGLVEINKKALLTGAQLVSPHNARTQ